jgi:hypothetical protein
VRALKRRAALLCGDEVSQVANAALSRRAGS